MARLMIITVFMVFWIALPCRAEGLDTLIEVGKGMTEIQKAYDAETRAYNGVDRALSSGALKKGMPAAAVKTQFGDPVVAIPATSASREKWVYKPAASDFFKGVRISLWFGADGLLEEILKEGQ